MFNLFKSKLWRSLCNVKHGDIAGLGTRFTRPPAPAPPTSTPTISGQCRPQISTQSWLEISGPSEPELGPIELHSRSISLHHVGHDQLHNAGHDQTDSLTKKGSGSLGEQRALNWLWTLEIISSVRSDERISFDRFVATDLAHLQFLFTEYHSAPWFRHFHLIQIKSVCKSFLSLPFLTVIFG